MVWMCWKLTDAFYFSAARWAFYDRYDVFLSQICVCSLASLFIPFQYVILVDLQFVDLYNEFQSVA